MCVCVYDKLCNNIAMYMYIPSPCFKRVHSVCRVGIGSSYNYKADYTRASAYHNLFSSLEKSTQFGQCTQKIYVMGNYTCPLPDVMEPYMQIHVGLHGRGTLEPKWYAAINF